MSLISFGIVTISLITIVGVDANIPLGECSLSCGENENPVSDVVRRSLVGPPGKRGVPGWKGEPGNTGEPGIPGVRGWKGEPGASCKCSEYDQLLVRLENLEEMLRHKVSTTAFFKITGWYQSENNQNLFYKLYKTPAAYAAAKKKCEEENARLASVGWRNVTIKREIYQALGISSGWTWIGLDILVDESRWVWSDGILSTRENTDWDTNQPDHAYERCGHIWGNTKINNISCSEELPLLLCEKDISP